jgi:hypothetical protein
MTDLYDPTQDQSDLLTELRSMFPWLDQVGLSPEFFQGLVAESASADEVIVKLRQQPQYKSRFSGMWRQDGSMRMNEAQYLARENDYRTLLRQYGYESSYRDPSSLVGFFDAEMDPNELRDRLATYRQVQESGAAIKDTFYVYAGIDLTDEQLYQAVVDPAAAQNLTDQYNQRVASSTFDYQTWITRATERGLQRVSDTLGSLQRSGALTGQAVQTVLRTDPNFARTIMDAIYTNAGQSAESLNLADLMSSFEYAAIGAAARNAGFELPTKERVAMIRAAGVDRAKAQAGYTQLAGLGASRVDDAVRRATGGRFSQQDFEDAAFLGNGQAQSAMQAGMAREDAAGQSGGGFNPSLDKRGRIVQGGMKAI